MTVQIQNPINSYTANGSTKIFPFTFRVVSAADIYVYVNDDVVNSGITVSINTSGIGGNVTFSVAPINGYTVTVRRQTSLDRNTDYISAGSLDADILDSDIDRLVMMIQDLNRDVSGGGFGSIPGASVVNITYPSYYNVAEYGAKGDGVTDDTAAIQSALNAASVAGGGTVFLPRGTYIINPVSINYLWLTTSSNRKNYACLLIDSNSTLLGEGHSTVLKLGSTLTDTGPTDSRGNYATTHMVVNKNAIGLPKTIVNNNIHVRDIKFDANLIHESGEGVTFCGVSRFSVSGCYFTNTYYECSYMVFCRHGIWHNNFTYRCGLPTSDPLNDGGGPMVDTSTGINITNNVFVDSGFYGILVLDSFHCDVSNNVVARETYSYSAGYQAIRVAGCSQTIITDNRLYESGYNGIWLHSSNDCIIKNNFIVKCGHFASAGSQIHGIQVDSNASRVNGRTLVTGNNCILNKGCGIAILDALLWADATQYNAGCIIDTNSCTYNYRDGIAVYGYSHKITNNVIESNGISETSGVVGNGYSAIALNGARYCTINGNSCQDIPVTSTINLNVDALLSPNNTLDPITVTHTARTQNYGISEIPAVIGSTKLDVNIAGVVLTATCATVGDTHGLSVGSLVKMDVTGVAGLTGVPGYYTVVTTPSTTVFTLDITGSSPAPANGNYTGDIYSSKYIMVSDYNIITNNNLSQNLNNPATIPAAGGHRRYILGAGTLINCGANSIKANNLGQ